MINLLPQTTQSELRAARLNTILVRYIFVTFLALAFLAAAAGALYVILAETKETAANTIQTDTAENTDLLTVQSEANAFRSNATSVRTILDNDVHYSTFLTALAALMPEGVVIESLNLSPNMFTTASTLTVYATSSTVAQQFSTNLGNSSLALTQPTVQSITTSSSLSEYTTVMTLSVTFNQAGAQ